MRADKKYEGFSAINILIYTVPPLAREFDVPLVSTTDAVGTKISSSACAKDEKFTSTSIIRRYKIVSHNVS